MYKAEKYVFVPASAINSKITIANIQAHDLHICQPEVLRIQQDGRIFWKGREVESDEEFRAAMMDVRAYFLKVK